MKKIFILFCIMLFALLLGCELPEKIDSALLCDWGGTDGLGGPWEDWGGDFFGLRFKSDGKAYELISIDGGVTWNETGVSIEMKKANNGEWETAMSSGTYQIIGNNMIWTTNSYLDPSYFSKILWGKRIAVGDALSYPIKASFFLVFLSGNIP